MGNNTIRRYDLDWLRVLVFILLIIYHVGLFFINDQWIISNNISYSWLKFPMFFMHSWRLPLLFIISGMGTFYALNSKSGISYVKERFIRLLLPLIFGILFIVPPQVYIQQIVDKQFEGNYFDFWFNNFIPNLISSGKPNWNHLWFIAYLLAFSILLAPLFIYLKKKRNSFNFSLLEKIFQKPLGFVLFLIPILLSDLFLEPLFPIKIIFKIIYSNLIYILFFLYGFILMTIKDIFWKVVLKKRFLLLSIGLTSLLIIYIIDLTNYSSWKIDSILLIFKSLHVWTLVLSLFGFAAKYLNNNSKILNYANKAVYPFYILHQTMIIIIGYYIKDVNLNGITKFSIMTFFTFFSCWIIYEFIIRKSNIVRPLFGVK